MANTTLTADIIAKEAVMILENELVMSKLVHRGYEDEYTNKVNGYEVGETVSIRRPADFTVRSGEVASTQEVVEGKTSITVDQVRGVLTVELGEPLLPPVRVGRVPSRRAFLSVEPEDLGELPPYQTLDAARRDRHELRPLAAFRVRGRW
jgi:hypothetical protein